MKKIRLTENDLNIIVSKVLNENTTPQEKILKTIDRVGLLKTIESIGYNTFDKINPDYFSDKENKIKLINQICEIEGGTIYLYDTIGRVIEIDRREVEHDSNNEMVEIDNIISIETGFVIVQTLLYDDGDMIDEPVDEYFINLIDLYDDSLNDLFESLVYNYFIRKVRLRENDLTNIVKRVITENTSLQDKLFKTIDRIGLLKTIESIGYNTFNDILPDYFQVRNNKIKLISTITEDGIHAYEIIDSDIKIDERDEWDGKEADYITYFNGDYVTITTYGFDEGDFMIDDPVDDWSVNLVDLRSKIIDLIFHKMVNKLF
jgi:hypothetical protein